MKTKQLTPFIIALLFISFTGCKSSGSGGEAQENNKENVNIQFEEVGKCLFSYRNHFKDLLTQEIVQKHYKADYSKVEINLDYSDKHPQYASLNYGWMPDKKRKKKISVGNIDIFLPYRVGIANMRKYDADVKQPIALFNRKYHNQTEAEKKSAQEAIEKQLDKSNHDQKTKEDTKKLAKVFTSGKNSLKFKAISGVGDAAAWDYFESNLKVLVGHVQFQVIADISDDIEKNQAIAKKIALELINKCN